MPLLWERVPTALPPDWDGGHPHPCSAIYRLAVPGGWLIRDETTAPSGVRGPAGPANGPTIFLPDPKHQWEVETDPPRRRISAVYSPDE